MYVASVALHDFRNYHSASLELAPAATLIIGANGQGKSNLLEAIGLLSIGKSVRGAPDAEVVRWGTPGSRIACELVGTAASRLEMQIEPGQRKQVRADGAALSSLSDLIGIMRTVHLAPDVIDYQFRSPSGRRRMLDILISQIDQGYLAALKRHRRIVQGINALCKHEQPDASVVDVWEAQLAWVAVEIMSRRNEVLKALQQAAQRYFEGLFRSESIEIKMRTTLPADGEDEDELRNACLVSAPSGQRAVEAHGLRDERSAPGSVRRAHRRSIDRGARLTGTDQRSVLRLEARRRGRHRTDHGREAALAG